MTFTSNSKVLLTLVCIILLSFAIGRYTATIGKSVDTKSSTQIDETKNTETHTTITQTKDPNGQVKTVTTIDSNTSTKIDEDKTKESHTQVSAQSKINVSALVGNDFNNPFLPIYGVSASKEFLGPITVGAWGLTNGTIGLSLGLNF